MYLKTLNIANFRNYESQKLEFNKHSNIFIGNNAQGKTSILEAIYVLAFTKSHRVYKDVSFIKNSAEYAKINSLINLNNKDIELDIVVSKLGKKAKYNQIELDKLSEYLGILNVVIFAPEDLELIKGNPKTRRKFLNLEIGQISKEYLYSLQNYRKVLKQRNDLLKSMQKKQTKDLMLLDVITDQLVGYQEYLASKRSEFVKEIESLAQNHYKKLASTKDILTIEYIPSIVKNIKEEYIAKYQYDIITGTTNQGIHRDELEFYINSFPVKSFGSQGEQRTAVLAIKLALIDFIYNYKKEYPVLLLDDVLSELDKTRQNNLLEYVSKDIQTFITTTDLNEIDLEKIVDYDIFQIENGTIKESDNNG
ncbi:DNA replication and repair protein RecF [Candidatus Izimaplasma bacterium HR1]|jgi:DNA replication and repair protein RecF|uniref:DNA replication/repair protein RecF n=1 Tax=Candidatus Izimoplasma sp. HR1 TaxID=1541959 RepID=UPI0004F8F510|nr:DNA replication and repair protein RecF [Candidatus Izimaplasma bacterium HR1]